MHSGLKFVKVKIESTNSDITHAHSSQGLQVGKAVRREGHLPVNLNSAFREELHT